MSWKISSINGINCKNQGSTNSPSLCFSHSVIPHLATVEEIKDKIEFFLGLEAVMQGHQKGVIDVVQQHIPLGHHVLHFVPAFDVLLWGKYGILGNFCKSYFAQHFHGVHLAISVVTDHVDAPETALANGFQVVKVGGLHAELLRTKLSASWLNVIGFRQFICHSIP